MTTAEAYLVCRSIARKEARNFYFAFVALPRHKSDAMCAVYAFMRKADDIADDESFSVETRRAQMQEWLFAWRTASDTLVTDDPIFLALIDTQRRFNISTDLLDQLVAGTTMDLQPAVEGVKQMGDIQVYESFNALYRYCYLVASVVGLVCIRIFGYTDPRAEEHAERVGIAFQLTNILRDIREDAERKRVYLPLDDITSAGATVDQLLALKPDAAVLNLIRTEIVRAENYYRSVDALVPMLDKDARAAMQVLAGIYHRLLKKIAANPAAVFTERVSVPTSTKLSLLGRGLIKTAGNRIFG